MPFANNLYRQPQEELVGPKGRFMKKQLDKPKKKHLTIAKQVAYPLENLSTPKPIAHERAP